MEGPTVETVTVPIPLSFREIADDIAERIRRGEYPPGEKLPSYPELADLYSVSVSTVQRAIGLLQHDGIVKGAQGRGLYVTDDALQKLREA
jgi:GntR family transcriptional regulator